MRRIDAKILPVNPTKLATELLLRRAMNSLAGLQVIRSMIAKFGGDDEFLALIDAREKELRETPAPEPTVTISQRARDVAEDLDLTDNEIMLDFLSGAEELLLAEGHDSKMVYKLMLQAGREYGAMIVEEFMRRRIQ